MGKQEDGLDNKIRGLRKPDERVAKFLISAELEDIRDLISQERARAVEEDRKERGVFYVKPCKKCAQAILDQIKTEEVNLAEKP